MQNLTYKDILEYIDNKDIYIKYIAVKTNKDISKDIYNLGACFEYDDCLDISEEYYKFLFHGNDLNQEKLYNIIKKLGSYKIKGKKFSFGFMNKEEIKDYKKSKEKQIEFTKKQIELKNIFTPTKSFKQIVDNGIVDNVYIYKVDIKNNLYNINGGSIHYIDNNLKNKIGL